MSGTMSNYYAEVAIKTNVPGVYIPGGVFSKWICSDDVSPLFVVMDNNMILKLCKEDNNMISYTQAKV